jgi:hypothetical protein
VYSSGHNRVLQWTGGAPSITDATTYVIAPTGGYDPAYPIEAAYVGTC